MLSKNLFDVTATLVIIALGAGIVQGAREGKPFASSASINFFIDIFKRTDNAVDMSTGQTQPDDRPFSKVATDSLKTPVEDISRVAESICTLPRYETDRRDRIPINLKDKAKGLRSIWQLQGVWGSPHCISPSEWTFVFEDGTKAIALQDKNLLRVSFP